MKRIGILGGTFDPIHNAHLLIAEQARDNLQLDEVWFMPAYIPPHKQEKREITGAKHRVQMVQAAIADNPHFLMTSVELNRGGASYTFDTMNQLVKDYPDTRFFFIIGGDMIEMLPKWHRIDELVQHVRFIGFKRPHSVISETKYTPYIDLVPMSLWDLSSTLIRNKLAAGKSIRYLVPAEVERYIKENRLYGTTGK
ncbi:nicotinate-nucleotide adenylyltransferase [Brevibacillus daliensis]|uniref:nicotinate-nucleotide adenylyltransferase n=1 Tax=Brevibacillus daliensis TaxID=2892995 RepID=UPI001E2ECD25|nr:nicotinate-nucleotide adenylyltransferase [Brevibacillus daliensis]